MSSSNTFTHHESATPNHPLPPLFKLDPRSLLKGPVAVPFPHLSFAAHGLVDAVRGPLELYGATQVKRKRMDSTLKVKRQKKSVNDETLTNDSNLVESSRDAVLEALAPTAAHAWWYLGHRRSLYTFQCKESGHLYAFTQRRMNPSGNTTPIRLEQDLDFEQDSSFPNTTSQRTHPIYLPSLSCIMYGTPWPVDGLRRASPSSLRKSASQLALLSPLSSHVARLPPPTPLVTTRYQQRMVANALAQACGAISPIRVKRKESTATVTTNLTNSNLTEEHRLTQWLQKYRDVTQLQTD